MLDVPVLIADGAVHWRPFPFARFGAIFPA
jgi:hypothetical protein